MKTDWIHIEKDPRHMAREKAKARELRQSRWWKNKLAEGVCYYCKNHFPPEELTMDHIIPLVRGGKTTRGNVVPCCKGCNSEKKYYTRAEILIESLQEDKPPKDEDIKT